MTGQDRTKGT